eukprot:scaffold2462_cov216-Skeletonema_menzelii.AAC.1
MDPRPRVNPRHDRNRKKPRFEIQPTYLPTFANARPPSHKSFDQAPFSLLYHCYNEEQTAWASLLSTSTKDNLIKDKDYGDMKSTVKKNELNPVYGET